ARTGLDAVERRRPVGGQGVDVRRPDADGTARSARGSCAGVRVFRIRGRLRLHQRRGSDRAWRGHDRLIGRRTVIFWNNSNSRYDCVVNALGSPPDGGLRDVLRSAGLRVTRPRMAVLTLLADHAHMSADEVSANVRAALPGTSLQTVYNVLGDLTAAGLLRRLEPPG